MGTEPLCDWARLGPERCLNSEPVNQEALYCKWQEERGRSRMRLFSRPRVLGISVAHTETGTDET
jgi:hypothetical protein